MLASENVIREHQNAGRIGLKIAPESGIVNSAIDITSAIESQILNELHRVPNVIRNNNKTILFLVTIINRVMLILGKDISITPTLTKTGSNSIISELKEYLYPMVSSLGVTYNDGIAMSTPIHLFLQSEPLLTIDYPNHKISSEADTHLIRSVLQSVIDILTTKYIAGRNISDIREKAMNDALLRIPGRLALNRTINSYKQLSSFKNKFPVSVLVIDLDHFKSVNDEYGHNIGDQVLIHVADLIRSKCKSYMNDSNGQATLYRMGGEELACIISHCTTDVALQFAKELNAELRNTPFFMNETVQIHQTASIGIATATSPLDFKDVILKDGSQGGTKVLKYADSAMFRAKESRDTTAVFEPELLNNLVHREGERRTSPRIGKK